MTAALRPGGGLHQILEDAAIRRSPLRITLRTQGLQLRLQLCELALLFPHLHKMPVENAVDVITVCLWFFRQQQNARHFLQTHVQLAAMTNETYALHGMVGIAAITIGRTYRLGQQTDFFVIAQGLRIHPGEAGNFTNLHEA